jgi:triosephosphate isomerase
MQDRIQMRQPLVAGNWKLNGSRAANTQLIQTISSGVQSLTRCDVMVCPSFVYLADVAGLVHGTAIMLGAQSVAREAAGAFTGEVSAAMLKDVGCSHVIVGHSERRILYGESDQLVADKFVAAQSAGLVPILCVGETFEQRDAGQTMDVVSAQVMAVLERTGIKAFEAAVVAYEPVWAIGTGLTATPAQAQEVHAHIRGIVAAADARIGAGLRILYGGSVKGANASELMVMKDIDGGLIGGASLDAAEFVAICKAAAGII